MGVSIPRPLAQCGCISHSYTGPVWLYPSLIHWPNSLEVDDTVVVDHDLVGAVDVVMVVSVAEGGAADRSCRAIEDPPTSWNKGMT